MTAFFVLSTGRCGTQWLTETLQLWSPDFVVQHEPLHLGYRPDLNTPQNPLAANAGQIQNHLNYIKQQLQQGKTYIETGFPCWRHLGWFRQQLGDVRVIHIHRDPVESVQSLLKLNAFIPPFLPHLPAKNLYLPGYEQDLMHRHQSLWPQLNPQEKNLWYWAEVQWQALNYQQQWPADDWLSLSFTRLFTEQTRQQLAQFFGCENTVPWPVQQKVDQFGAASVPFLPDFPLLAKLPQISDIAIQLGYPPPDATRL